MTNDDSSPDQGTSELRAEITNYGSPQPDEGFTIAPEDQHIADRILAMDPMRDVPSPVQIPDGWVAPPLKLTALPVDRQAAVATKLERLQPGESAAREAEFVADEIRAMLPDIRIKCGVGPGASEYHREQAAIAREYRDLCQQFDFYAAELSEISHHATEFDSKTGEALAVPVYAVQGNRAKAYAEHQEDLLRQMRLLIKDDGSHGLEGEKRRLRALAASVRNIKALEQQAAEAAEASAKADEINREERVRLQAESLARMRRT